MITKFDEALANQMISFAENNFIAGSSGRSLHRPVNAVTLRPYTKDAAIFLACLGEKLGCEDPRFCSLDDAKAMGLSGRPGMEGGYVMSRVLYTEDAFGYPLPEKDWAFRNVPQLVFNIRQFENAPALEKDSDGDRAADLSRISDAFLLDMYLPRDYHDSHILRLAARRGVEGFCQNSSLAPNSLELRADMAALLVAMDLDLPFRVPSFALWAAEIMKDRSSFRQAAADAEAVAQFIEGKAKIAQNKKLFLWNDDLLDYARNHQRTVPFLQDVELLYLQIQNMKALLNSNAQIRKANPDLGRQVKKAERDFNANHSLKSSVTRKLDLVVGLRRSEAETVFKSLSQKEVSWRSVSFKKFEKAVQDVSGIQKNIERA